MRIGLHIWAYIWSSSLIELNKKKGRDVCDVATGANYGVASYLSWDLSLRYVGVIWFIFNVLRLLSIRFTQPNLCCISKSMMKHEQKSDENFGCTMI